MDSEGARLKAHLKLVGEVKAASHREVTEAHLARPPGERLERAIELCDFMIGFHRQTAHMRTNPPKDDAAETWARVNEKLGRSDGRRP